MPDRTLHYDLFSIDKQRADEEKRLANIARKQGLKGKAAESEVRRGLSSFKPKPVVTFVINLSGKKWTGPKSFVDLLDFKILPKEKYPLQYCMILIDPWAMTEEELDFFKSEFGTLLRILAHKTLIEQFHYATQEIPIYSKIQDRDMLTFLKNYFHGFDFPGYREKGEKAMMQAAMLFEQELKEAGLNEGQIIGISKEKTATVERMFELHCPIDLIAQSTALPIEKVEEIIQSMKSK